MRYLHLADKHDLPRIVTIQNPYSLLNRSYEVGLAVKYKKGLLAYSAWALARTGKYLNGAKPAARVTPCSAVLPATAARRRKSRRGLC
jgi:aryl-alcohol dehydrogenase-like predicted oxidoreductase